MLPDRSWRISYSSNENNPIADKVGLGKTIETGLILKYLLTSQKVQRVLLLVPASVQVQWQQELREKFNLHFWSYSQGEFTDPHGKTTAPTSNPWNTVDRPKYFRLLATDVYRLFSARW